MILYKYYSFNAGMKAVASRQLGFRKPKEFNDPFELSAFSAVPDEDLLDTTDGLGVITPRVDSVADQVVICSLTRSPINPLMWSHYGNDHRGIVVGYDVNVPLLTEGDSTLIPVDEGSVFYSHSKESDTWSQRDKDNIFEIVLSALGIPSPEQEIKHLMKRLLLNKSIHWAYEEEVRVVKILSHWGLTVEEFWADALNRYTSVPSIKGLVLYDEEVPIVSVHLGCRTLERNLSRNHRSLLGAIPLLYEVQMDRKSWDLKATLMNADRKRELAIPVRSKKLSTSSTKP